MNWQTKKKVEEIKELIYKGYSRKDILQKKFNRSVSNLNKHLETTEKLYSIEELKVLKGEKIEETNVSIKESSIALEKEKAEFLREEENWKSFQNIIAHTDEIIEMIKERKEGKKINKTNIVEHLDIPNEFSGLDVKTKSFRISKEIDDEFKKFCEEYKHYSKTAIFNYAISEFMKKYK